MSLLTTKQLFIKEKAFKIFNHFDIYDKDNKQIGYAEEAKKWAKKVTGRFELNFYEKDKLLMKVKKPFSIIKPRAYVYDVDDTLLGYFVKKIIALRPRFYLYDAHDKQIGMLEGDFIAWNFELVDENEKVVVDINKRFSGIAREMFTTADAYRMTFSDSKTIDRRIALATPFMIDLLLKESQNSRSRRGFNRRL